MTKQITTLNDLATSNTSEVTEVDERNTEQTSNEVREGSNSVMNHSYDGARTVSRQSERNSIRSIITFLAHNCKQRGRIVKEQHKIIRSFEQRIH